MTRRHTGPDCLYLSAYRYDHPCILSASLSILQSRQDEFVRTGEDLRIEHNNGLCRTFGEINCNEINRFLNNHFLVKVPYSSLLL